ncbi:MAG: MoaD/ThiS family protein [Acetobacteraceae bacterium]
MPMVAFTTALHRFVPAPATQVAGTTVGQALAAVFALRPALRGYLLDDQGALRRHVIVYVNGVPACDRTSLADPVGTEDEIYVFQALTGG